MKLQQGIERGVYANSTVPAGFSTYESTVNNIEALFELQTPFSDSLSLINGVNYDNRKEQGALLISPAGNVETMSAYSQLRAESDALLKGTILTLGARLDTGRSSANTSYEKVSPRIGVVQKLTSRLTARVAHGQAIRSPGIKEFGLNAESQPFLLSKLADLKPETIETNEASLSYTVSRFIGTLTAFQNKTEDSLDGTSSTATTDGMSRNFFINGNGEVTTQGFEVETRFSPFKQFDVLFNASYAKAEDKKDQQLNDIPSLKINTGISYRIPAIDFQATLISRHVADYRVSSGDRPHGVDLLDANFIKKTSKDTSFELQVRNALDKDHKLPKGGVPDVPVSGRSVTASLNMSF